jgi:HKD family nuclease
MKITIDTQKISPDKVKEIFRILGDNYTMSLSGKEKSELLEARVRITLGEPRPNTTDYDFCQGNGYFFEKDKIELKQFDALGSSPKLQQVKPALYNKILVAAEYPNNTEWWVISSNKISSVAGKENREEGKLTLQRQHKGNLLEGQVTFTKQFKNEATKITTTGPVNYTKKDLGLTDEEIFEILNFVKNH